MDMKLFIELGLHVFGMNLDRVTGMIFEGCNSLFPSQWIIWITNIRRFTLHFVGELLLLYHKEGGYIYMNRGQAFN